MLPFSEQNVELEMQARAQTSGGASLLRSKSASDDTPEMSRESGSRSKRQEARQRNRATQALLSDWLADDSGYDEETWPELKSALEEIRSSAAEGRLFRD